MPQSPADQSGKSVPSSDFGANEWLVEEMREQYDRDPASVGPEWAAFFKGDGAGTANGQSGAKAEPA
ncbi:MAG TPA: hypothetical protein VF728_03980, partial [Nocardioides sp.]